MMRKLGLIALTALVLPTAATATNEITEFTLDNGMQVVVIEDHRSPAVTHMVWYPVGAADEPLGQSGIAHFLEHLMFKATDDLESGEFDEIVDGNGGDHNAFTSWDYTGYYQRIAVDRLDLMMEIEADRMTGLALDPEEVMTERSVILEERAEVVESSPGSIFNEQLAATTFLHHPYGVPIIGWRHEMEQLTLENARDWYENWYAPNNAILIVAGDVEPEDVRAMANVHYGVIPARELPERIRMEEPPQISDRRIVYEDERVANPYVLIEYIAPVRESGAQEQAAALVMLAQVLGGSGQTAVLPRTLQIEEERSLWAGVFYGATSRDAGTFTIGNMPVPGTSLEEAEADLLRVVAQFLEDGIDPEQFARIQFQFEAARIYEQDDAAGIARSYGVALSSGLTVADQQAWPDVLAAVTPEDVMAAARTLFLETHSVTGYLDRPEAPTEEATE